MTTPYTRTCDSCPAKLTWDDENKRYVDDIFPKERHDHKRYLAVLEFANRENKVEQPRSSYEDADAEIAPDVEGQECRTCKANGFPNQFIFFNDAAKGTKTNRVIPLARPDKVDGKFVPHEHRKQGDGKGPAGPDQGKPYVSEPTPSQKESAAVKAAQGEGVDFSALALNDTLKAYTQEIRNFTRWFEDIRPKIDVIIAFINDQSIKKANE